MSMTLLAATVLATAGYAAVRHATAGAGSLPKSATAAKSRRPPPPRLVEHPDRQTNSTSASFALADPARHVSFRCRLDASAWARCGRRIYYESLAPAEHRFYARAIARKGHRSSVARFSWTINPAQVPPDVPDQGAPFVITQETVPPPLYPGDAPAPLPVTLENPNADPISITSLTAAVASGPSGCDASNLRLVPSTASVTSPIAVPAHGTVTLPDAGAEPPAIQLLDLPLNQDACRDGSFSLVFTGSGHG
jgi:hypothetical protein